jgi:signal transduction histidine kinase
LALSNLIQNSLEALEDATRKELTLSTTFRNGFVRLGVSDSGYGISEEVRPRLFEPFFTTKKGGHVGLGLFLARRVLEPYGASFTSVSRPGKTAFGVCFPVRGEPGPL